MEVTSLEKLEEAKTLAKPYKFWRQYCLFVVCVLTSRVKNPESDLSSYCFVSLHT